MGAESSLSSLHRTEAPLVQMKKELHAFLLLLLLLLLVLLYSWLFFVLSLPRPCLPSLSFPLCHLSIIFNQSKQLINSHPPPLHSTDLFLKNLAIYFLQDVNMTLNRYISIDLFSLVTAKSVDLASPTLFKFASKYYSDVFFYSSI